MSERSVNEVVTAKALAVYIDAHPEMYEDDVCCRVSPNRMKVLHRCGHTGTVKLVGTVESQEARIAEIEATDCDKCLLEKNLKAKQAEDSCEGSA